LGTALVGVEEEGGGKERGASAGGELQDGVPIEMGEGGGRQPDDMREPDSQFVLLRKGVALGVAYSGVFVFVCPCVVLCHCFSLSLCLSQCV
jgi:hypothetical protein